MTSHILTKRPDEMPFEIFKKLLSLQKTELRQYLKGQFIWHSKNAHKLSTNSQNKGTFVGNTNKITSLNTYEPNKH